MKLSSALGAAGAMPLYAPGDAFARLEISPEGMATNQIYGFRNADTRARPFKMLRTQIGKRVIDEQIKIIGVTSASPNVGKTFVAANLAAALSRIAEFDVCLVDMDLHRPALAARFGMGEDNGIHDLLSGEIDDVDQVAKRINDERLVLIPGFKRNVATGELLTSARGDALFGGLRAMPRSTIVIVDMPPIFADDDAVIIGHRIDGYLLVVEDGKTTRKQMRDVMRLLSPTPMLGSILNRYRHQLFGDEHGYGRSYGYGSYY